MKKFSVVITAEQLREELVRKKGHRHERPTTVRGEVHIDFEDDDLDILVLENLTFIGKVTIKQLTASIKIKAANFLGGIILEDLTIGDISIVASTAKSMYFRHCVFGVASLRSVKGLLPNATFEKFPTWLSHEKPQKSPKRSFGNSPVKVRECLDLSGLQLNKGFSLNAVTFASLELIDATTWETIQTPKVQTDDPTVACQFRLIGVPVFMATEAVRAGLSTAEGVRSALLTA